MRLFRGLLFVVLLGAGFSAVAQPDPLKSDGFSHYFQFRVNFDPGTEKSEARFVATLKNVSGQSLQVRLNDRKFRGRFRLTSRPAISPDYLLDDHMFGPVPHIEFGQTVVPLAADHALRNLRNEFADREYVMLILTSEWQEPKIRMEAGQEIRWDVALSTLSGFFDEAISHRSLRGCKVVCEMDAGVITAAKSSREFNAVQVSPEIEIATH